MLLRNSLSGLCSVFPAIRSFQSNFSSSAHLHLSTSSINTKMGSIDSDTMFDDPNAVSSSSSSPFKEDSIMTDMHNEIGIGQKNNNRNQRTHHRGRSNQKRSESTEENACVVAFLIKAQDAKQAKIIDKIQEIRRRFDQAYRRWEPHLTLISPFIVPFSTPLVGDQSFETKSEEEPKEQHTLLRDTLDQLCRTIQAVCLNTDQHTLTLDEVGHFALKRYDTLHLRPSTEANNDTFLQLQSKLEAALPLTQSNARSKRGQAREAYKPHLTLGQSSESKVEVSQQLKQMASQLLKAQNDVDEPFRIKVDKIQLMVKPVNRSGPYDVYREFILR
jgi:2'-5' RNA ligase